MTRLKRSKRARRMDSQTLQNNNIEEDTTSETDHNDGSPHSAASKFENGCNSDSHELTETSKFPGTSGVAAATSEIETNDVQSSNTSQPKRHDEDQASKGNITKCICHQGKLMCKAALQGDWQTAEMLLGLDPNLAHAPITRDGDTALHMAAAIKHTKFVQELVKRMGPSVELSSLKNKYGYTAFHFAAASGTVDIASVMMDKDASLPTIPGGKVDDNMFPLHLAVLYGNRDTVSYIQEHTQVENYVSSKDHKLFELFRDTIHNSMYDAALKIWEKNRYLATMADEDGSGTALHVLAQHDISGISALERFVTNFAAVPCLSWLKRRFEQPLMRKKARLLVENLWADIRRLEQDDMLNELIRKLRPILHDAAKAGNVEFLTMLTRSDPDLIWETNNEKDKYTIFHIAVSQRQESVFSLFPQLGGIKNMIAAFKDVDGNNILHLAGKSAPSSRLSIVSGAALQMQRELMWFKEMEKILPSFCLKMKNKAGLIPRELFSKEHKDLLKEGETWMRDTADSCMLIATIMLTVAFTAAFTVPGGNSSETGIPILLKRTWFKVFVASDVVAMFCSTFSIMMFFSILTSRFQEDDFLARLPRKLFLGLMGLFGSLVGTISAFTSAYFLMFNVERAWLPSVLGYFPCVLLTIIFLHQHIPLILDTMSSTFRCGYLFRSSKHSLY